MGCGVGDRQEVGAVMSERKPCTDRSLIEPTLKPDDESAARDNWEQLNAIVQNVRRSAGKTTIQLPAGVFYVGRAGVPIFAFDETLAGLTIQGSGSGTTLLMAADRNLCEPIQPDVVVNPQEKPGDAADGGAR